MQIQSKKMLCSRLLGIAALVWLAPACSKVHSPPSGRVIDAVTKEPLAGMYVLAEYRDAGSDGGHSRSWCVATQGTYTDADGRYSLPGLRGLQGNLRVAAVDYKMADWLTEDKRTWYGGYERVLTGTITMSKRDQRPIENEQIFFCDRFGHPDDVISNIEYLRVLERAYLKYGPNNVSEHFGSVFLYLRTRKFSQ